MTTDNKTAAYVASSAEDPDVLREIDREIEILGLRYLALFAAAFMLYYLIRGGFYWINLPPDQGRLLAGLAWISGIYGGIILMMIRKEKITGDLSNVFSLSIGILLIINVFANLYVTNSWIQLTNALNAVVAFGMTSAHFRNWILQILLTLAPYALGLMLVPEVYQPHFAIGFVASAILSLIIYMTHGPILRERVALQVQIRTKAEALAKANAVKGKFLANMTHELRTPLTGVLGMVDLLDRTELDRDQATLLRTARKSARFLMAVINDILDLSKLEEGKLTLHSEPVDVVEVTRDVVALLDGSAREKNLALILDLPPDEPIFVRGDDVRIGQVLFNLVGNAIKFTEEGRVTITLTSERRLGKRRLKWVVEDTGIGIPKDKQLKLFERFEQLDSGPTRKTSGSGLGLAICRELIRLMGGSYGVDSEVGSGSRFWFSLELASASPKRSQDSDISAEDRLKARPLRILVAEDNPINLMLIEKLLDGPDWTIESAVDGAEAFAKANNSPKYYDVILMDIQMPVMDGVTAAQEMVAAGVRAPIIALTANTLEDDVGRYRKAGISQVVGKPINAGHLYHAMDVALAEQPNWAIGVPADQDASGPVDPA